MGIADSELHTDQAAGDKASDELAPESLGLGPADIKADDLSPAGLMHRMGNLPRGQVPRADVPLSKF